jgi:inner membrane protein
LGKDQRHDSGPERNEVDNVCHTLAGAAFGEAGLKRTTKYATVTLMIAANLPDVDVLVFATGLPSVAIRRGWTHGVLAQALLPILLAAAVMWFARWRRAEGVRFARLAALSYVGVLSHVFLDLLNNYGVRLLMPLSGQWFYGDAVFIIDIWLWIALGIAVWFGSAKGQARRAVMILAIAGVYVVGMIVSARMARAIVREAWRERTGREPVALMVGPAPITPFHKQVIVDGGDTYTTGSFVWFGGQTVFEPEPVAKNERHPSVRAAIAADRKIQAVLTWSRFPYFTVEPGIGGDVVTLRDLRFGDRVGAVRATVAASRDSSRPSDRSR